jgi:nitric oxide reductase large subunit
MVRYWLAFVAVLVVSFAVLGWTGVRVYQEAPPIPDRVVTTDGREVIAAGAISAGQNVWQAMGGMEVGSIWGHGSYVAPDWTADWLHREATFVLDEWARAQFGQTFANLDLERQGGLQGRLQAMVRTNHYDPSKKTLTIEPERARALYGGPALRGKDSARAVGELCDRGGCGADGRGYGSVDGGRCTGLKSGSPLLACRLQSVPDRRPSVWR